MKIAILGTRGIPNHYGGFEQFAENLSFRLVDLGHDVSVFNSHNHPYKKKMWKGVNIIHSYDPEFILGTPGQFIYDLNCILHCRRHHFDIVLQLGYTSSSIWNFLFPKKSCIITNMDGLEWKRSKFSKLTQYFIKYSEKKVVKYSDYFVADSIGIQQYLFKTYKINSTYIPYGATINNLSESKILNKFNLKKFDFDLVIARLEPENNIEMIIKGYLQSNKKRKLVIVGSLNTKFGQYLYKKYKKNSIIFAGFISENDSLNNLRHYSNLYFHGHSVGGTNPSLLEAMSSSSLICAHDNIFNKSILAENAYYFTKVKDIQNLINKILKKDQQHIIKANLVQIQNLFSWKKIRDSYNNLFKQAIKNNI